MKTAAPVIQPDPDALVGKRVLDNDVCRAVAINIQRGYSERRFDRLESEDRIATASEMKFYLPGAVGRPRSAMIEKDGAVRFLITVEIGSGHRLTEQRTKAHWRRETHPRQRTFEPVLRPKR